MSGIRIEGNTSGMVVEVTGSNQIKIISETNVSGSPQNVGAIKMFSENDNGIKMGSPYLSSPETDSDFRLRVSLDTPLDDETFNYIAQNTGKHNNQSTTMTLAYTSAGLTTNSSSILNQNTGVSLSTYALFSFPSNGGVLYAQLDTSFSSQPVSNTIIDFGLFARPTAIPYAPLDGAYFRLNSSGLSGVVNHNGSETTTSVFNFTYSEDQVYKFIVATSNNKVNFWIDDVLYGTIQNPSSQGQPFMAASVPLSFRHAIVGGAAGNVLRATFRGYGVSVCGLNQPRTLAEVGSAVYGSYQGISGGAMGQLIAGTVTTGTLVKPAAAVPANASLTANLPNSLGGRIYEQLATGLAANTDGIYASYTVPPTAITGSNAKRLKVNGIKLSGMVSQSVAGGPAFTEWYIAFGHTADSLQTTEAATTKAPRRVMLPELTTYISGSQAVSTLLTSPQNYAAFANPIYVNPGERIALVGNKTINTAITAGVLCYTYQFDYSWE